MKPSGVLEDRPDRRRVYNAKPFAQWYRAMREPVRYVLEGFAVIVNGKRVNKHGLQWKKACILADKTGGKVAIWTSQ